MSHLRIYRDDTRSDLYEDFTTFEAIRDAMAEANIRFERWDASRPLAPGAGVSGGRSPDGASQSEVLAAYAGAISRLRASCGFATEDVVSISPSTPNHAEARKKFLDEHTHSEDEARFFVEGSGQFYIHHGRSVFALECTKGDLINVPAGTRHWFDMGPAPHFVAIRMFTDPKGWVAAFTGDDVASRFPRYESR